MQQIVLDAQAGDIPAELARRGISGSTRVHVVVELADTESLPMARIAQDGRALDWLEDEPDLYTDNDLAKPGR
ncbi:hypothetical protein LPC08_25260 (plasmid) [Roseomonas sp. OT10]|uniref:hypothetical protein n=1 Tax=Roseomonas cutis TaxID=2897332 RepID=UPI001E41DE2B|nr:hypothetical protein [Roseomonas sp. OT10]UFN51575.1 hypothetical protein LPC08_25260 [Roseomonas sp. OT10]